MRKALEAIANEGLTQKAAAEQAGIHEATLCKALKRPAVAMALEAMQQRVIAQAAEMKAGYKALAMRHAFHLMKNANSEAVQARMVEFLAGEPHSGTQVNVAVNVDRGGYEFVKPGQRVVDIRPAIDSVSSGDDGQVIDLQANPPTVDE